MAIILKNSWNVPPARWGSPADIRYAIKVNSEKVYNLDPDSNKFLFPVFWGFPLLDYSESNTPATNYGATYKDQNLTLGGSDYVDITGFPHYDNKTIFARIKTGIDNVYQEIFSYNDRISDADYRFSELKLKYRRIIACEPNPSRSCS